MFGSQVTHDGPGVGQRAAEPTSSADDAVEAAVQTAMACLAVIGGLCSEEAENAYRKALADALRAADHS